MDPYVDRQEITVEVEEGIAMLSGQVDTHFEKWQTGDLAARVPGVTRVDNNLSVANPSLPYELMIYDWDPVIYDVDYTPQDKRDEEIREDIEQELWWSPFIDEDAVTVSVQDGIATLTGTVDTKAERLRATEEAFEGGARGVENALIVVNSPDVSS